MKIDILTIFPEMFANFLTSSLLGKAVKKKIFVKLPEGYESIYSAKIPSDVSTEYFGWTVYED